MTKKFCKYCNQIEEHYNNNPRMCIKCRRKYSKDRYRGGCNGCKIKSSDINDHIKATCCKVYQCFALLKRRGKRKDRWKDSNEYVKLENILHLFIIKKGWNMLCPSVDRIDNTKGYLITNIDVVEHLYNAIKKDRLNNDLKLEEEYYYARYDSYTEEDN